MTPLRWRVANEAPTGPVTPVELFFDLVFVFTLTQLTQRLEHELSFAEAGRSLLLFAVLWWMYTGYVWLTNHVPPRRAAQKLLLFAGMAGFFVAALGVPHAFDRSGLVFGAGYLIVIVVHLLLFTQADVLSGVLRLAPFNLGSGLLILGAGFTHGPAVYALWVAAFLVQAVAPYVAPRRSGVGTAQLFHVAPAHFAERHGLLVIVALGESVVAIGMGVDVGRLSAALAGSVVLALALPGALWWAYFMEADAGERALGKADGRTRSLLAVNAYFFAHIPMLLGIVAAAAGMRAVMAHPHAPLALPSAVELAGGVALFLVGIAAFRHALAIDRPASRLVAAAATLATIPIGTASSAGLQLAVIVAVAVATIVLDRRGRAE